MKIEIKTETVQREQRDLDNSLAEYERSNTYETGIAETGKHYIMDFLVAVIFLPIIVVNAVFGGTDRKPPAASNRSDD